MVVAADAARVLARDLAKTSGLLRASPRDPDPTFVIFDDAVDAVAEVLSKFVVLPTKKAPGSSDPEGAVR